MSDNPYPDALPCPLWTHTALLRPIALWSLDTFGDDPPMLIGVEFGSSRVRFHPVFLDPEDPIDTMADLIAPDEWDVLAVVANAYDVSAQRTHGVIAHAVDRAGRAATELDQPCGQRRPLRSFGGRLHDACLEMLGVW